MVITPADLVRWHADFAIDDPMEPRELVWALAQAVKPRDLVWVLAHAVAEALPDVRALDIVRDVARTSASSALRHTAPGQPGWCEGVAAEDRRQIEQMVQMLEGA